MLILTLFVNNKDTYYNITAIQANYYDKVATDSLFSNIYIYIYIYIYI